MNGYVCSHCKTFVPEGQPHDCWTTTEAALTRDLSPDLLDAWERLRETAAEFGEQRIYASHNSIMFSRRVCYFFVRPKRSFLELTIFLGRGLKAPQIRRVRRSSRSRFTHVVHVRHRDEVEAPITDWLLEAYQLEGKSRAKSQTRPARRRARRRRRAEARPRGRRS
jgi:hypothetical protein